MGLDRPCSNGEKHFSADANLISTTDSDSILTYANPEFCDVAGYSHEELTDQPHNIVRHSDMPKAAFKQMWGKIQSGRSWMGIVKNACKDGRFYWVSAFVTPITDATGKITEYQSIRSKPSQATVQRAEQIYSSLQQGKAPARLSWPRFSYRWCRYLMLAIMSLCAGMILLGGSSSVFSAILLLAAVISLVNEAINHRRLKLVMEDAHQAYDNPLMELVYTGHYDDYSVIELALQKRKSELRAVVARASETSSNIHDDAKNELSNLESMQKNLAGQSIETDSVATAMTEMAHSIHDVADNANATSQLVQEASDLSAQGQNSVSTTMTSVSELHQSLEAAKSIIHDLSSSSQQIEQILDVIGSIAEQTNLLALNAAIEAARAGEAGRGFAVVADEVRSLASKTQSSTGEIHSMISHLQQTAQHAVKAMEQGGELSELCRENAQNTEQVLDAMNEKLDEVTNASQHIAAAVSQQASVTEEINTNVVTIQQLSSSNLSLSEESVGRTGELVSKLSELQRLMAQFQKA